MSAGSGTQILNLGYRTKNMRCFLNVMVVPQKSKRDTKNINQFIDIIVRNALKSDTSSGNFLNVLLQIYKQLNCSWTNVLRWKGKSEMSSREIGEHTVISSNQWAPRKSLSYLTIHML